MQLDAGVMRLSIRGEIFDVQIAGDQGQTITALVMLDHLTPDRLTALGRFWNAVTGRLIPPDPRMTAQRRGRARQMLRAVDAKVGGAHYRAIAASLFPQHDNDAATWVGTAIRETTIRLVRDGQKLVRGGYRSLLQRPRRDR